MKLNNFYVYVLFRPWNGEPCYVGKGSGKRVLSHKQSGVLHSNKHLGKIFAKAVKLQLEVPAVIARKDLYEEEAFEIEMTWIKAIGRTNVGGPLVNCTDGGEGSSGYIASKKTRKLLSKNLAKHVASLTEEQRLNWKRRCQEDLSVEQRSDRSKKSNAAISPAKRSQIKIDLWSKKTPEERSEIVRRSNAALTFEQRSERSKAIHAKRTPEQRSEAARKGHETKKRNAHSWPSAVLASRTDEQPRRIES